MVIVKPQVTHAIKMFNLKEGDIFYIVKPPSLVEFYLPDSDITRGYIDDYINKNIQEGEMFGVTYAGITMRDGELKKSFAPQVFWNYWVHDNELIKMEHIVPGFY